MRLDSLDDGGAGGVEDSGEAGAGGAAITPAADTARRGGNVDVGAGFVERRLAAEADADVPTGSRNFEPYWLVAGIAR